jgi:hypothetical protein
VPVLACAVCPACLTTYAKLFSVLGVGFGLSEFHHLMLLVVAISASIGVSAWRSWRTRRRWPIAIALTGSALVATGHFAGDLHYVEWAGVLVLLVGGLVGRRGRVDRGGGLVEQGLPLLVDHAGLRSGHGGGVRRHAQRSLFRS